jgi:membrane complex biogenesis BtpA family protein
MLPERAIIAMVHVQALPGSPRHAMPLAEIVAQARSEAKQLSELGFDAVIVENMHDRPYVNTHGPEIVACMTRIVGAIRESVPKIPMGVQILSSGEREAIAVAHACGAQFIRCENFVFAHVADEGLMSEAKAGPLLRYRASIGAGAIKVFADVKKKHASHTITADVAIDEMAEAAAFFGADGVIVTGIATGRPTDANDVRTVRSATSLPVLVGSGVTPSQVRPLFEAGASALIVGSSIKRDGVWSNPLDPERCRAILKSR